MLLDPARACWERRAFALVAKTGAIQCGTGHPLVCWKAFEIPDSVSNLPQDGGIGLDRLPGVQGMACAESVRGESMGDLSEVSVSVRNGRKAGRVEVNRNTTLPVSPYLFGLGLNPCSFGSGVDSGLPPFKPVGTCPADSPDGVPTLGVGTPRPEVGAGRSSDDVRDNITLKDVKGPYFPGAHPKSEDRHDSLGVQHARRKGQELLGLALRHGEIRSLMQVLFAQGEGAR